MVKLQKSLQIIEKQHDGDDYGLVVEILNNKRHKQGFNACLNKFCWSKSVSYNVESWRNYNIKNIKATDKAKIGRRQGRYRFLQAEMWKCKGTAL